MIYLIVTIILLIVVIIARIIMQFNPNKKQSKEKTDQQINEYIEMLKKYQKDNKK